MTRSLHRLSARNLVLVLQLFSMSDEVVTALLLNYTFFNPLTVIT